MKVVFSSLDKRALDIEWVQLVVEVNTLRSLVWPALTDK